jgi:hypothetical protein
LPPCCSNLTIDIANAIGKGSLFFSQVVICFAMVGHFAIALSCKTFLLSHDFRPGASSSIWFENFVDQPGDGN